MSPLETIPRGRDAAEEKLRTCLVSQDAQLTRDFVLASSGRFVVDIKRGMASLLSESSLTSLIYVVDTSIADMDLWPTPFYRFREALSLKWFLLTSKTPDPTCEGLLPIQLRFFDRGRVSGSQIVAAIQRELQTEGEHHITAMRFVPEGKGFAIRLGTGRSYFLPVSDLPEADRTRVVSAEMGEDDSYFIVRQASGNWFEVPWDDVLYHCEPAYPYYRQVAVSHERDNLRIGERLRELRKHKGLTIAELAHLADMKRPNLSRLEHGRHRPSLETLERLSVALGVPMADLVRRQ